MRGRALALTPKMRELQLALGELPAPAPRNDQAEREFAFQCRAFKLPDMTPQWRFPQSAHPDNKRRMWRCDFVFPVQMLMIEIDGGIWIKGAHAHPVDITRNMTKQNDAVLLGFAVLRFTPPEVKSGHAAATTQRALHRLGWRAS